MDTILDLTGPDPIDDLQLPPELLAQIKVSTSLPVRDLLALPLPFQNSRELGVRCEVATWFSYELPTDAIPTYVEKLQVPSHAICSALGDRISGAIADGFKSICHPTRSDCTYPLDIFLIYKWADELIRRATIWKECLKWLTETAESEAWPDLWCEQMERVVMDCPSKARLRGFCEAVVPSSVVFAENVLSSAWFVDDSIDAVIEVIQGEMQSQGAGVDGKTQIALSSLGGEIVEGRDPKAGEQRRWGEKLCEGTLTDLHLPFNVNRKHWIHVHINTTDRLISIGDSLPAFTRIHQTSVIRQIKRWLLHYVADISDFIFSFTGFPVPIQGDDSSCGPAACNSIHRRCCSGVGQWSPDRPGTVRAYYFIKCLQAGIGRLVRIRIRTLYYSMPTYSFESRTTYLFHSILSTRRPLKMRQLPLKVHQMYISAHRIHLRAG
jgi:hypothetical protein